MAEVVIGEKTWDRFDYDILCGVIEERGERKSYHTEDEPHRKMRGPTIRYILPEL